MNKNLKEVFEQVRAEEELKNNTKEFIFQKTNGYTRTRTKSYYHLILPAVCSIFLIFGGHWLYFTPTVEISIDINPSMELGVNRFGTIISAEGYNEDGQELINSLNIKYMDYFDAVLEIIDSDYIAALLSDDGVMTIAVTGTDEEQSSKVLSDIKSCTAGESNTYCYYAHAEEIEKAHEAGLSYGKYRAFLEVQKLNPDITASEIQNMTMREIRDLIASLSDGEKNGKGGLQNGKGNSQNEKGDSQNEKGHGRQENGKGYGRRKKYF